jgi:hypothetical protein
MRTFLLPILVAAPMLLATTAATAAPVDSQTASSDDLARDLIRIRQQTMRFRDVNVALSEGYVVAPPGECVTAASEGQPQQLGAMGVHFVRPDLLGITTTAPRVNGTGTNTDFSKPTVLVYEPQADGSYELVALENLVFAQAWQAAGHSQPPSFHGNQYYLMIDNPATSIDEAHDFEPHYELHIWLYRSNPAGMFMPFNTRASCGLQAKR